MASNLTIISGTSGNVSARNFGGPQSSRDSNDASAFATLLGNSDAAKSSGAKSAEAAGNAGAPSDSGQPGEKTGRDSDIAAATPDAAFAAPAQPQAMVDFIDALTGLKASLERGETPDPQLLARIDSTLNELAETLGLDLSTLTADDLDALLETINDDGTDPAAMFAQLLAPLTQSLAGDPNGDAATLDAGATAQLKLLGAKLTALISALENGEVEAARLTGIGLPQDGDMDSEIEAALARFTATKPDIVPDEPELAIPVLKTTEPVLTGKAEAAPDAKPAADAVVLSDKGKSRDDGNDRPATRPIEPPQREARPNAAPNAPAAGEAQASPAAANQAAQDASTIRIEAGPRIVQAGYQTSQQQLNLPQLAFELARQVQDGNTRFQIRLDPPELGKIDVRLDIDKGGQIHARLTVEKAETLDLMQRDQRALERALQQAGLDGNKTNLEFSLKQNPFAGQDRQDRGGEPQFGGTDPASAEAEEIAPSINLYRGSLQASGVNIIA